MEQLMTKLEYYLHFFGYAKDDRAEQSKGKPQSSTFNSYEPQTLDFYDYKGQAKKENQAAFLDFMNVNENMFKLRIKNKEAEASQPADDRSSAMTINANNNDKGDGFSLLLAKDVLHYLDVLELATIEEPVKVLDFKKGQQNS